MPIISLVTPEQVIRLNKTICAQEGNIHSILKPGGIDSALSAAYYAPADTNRLMHGGIARVAGSMAFYISTSHIFMDGNKRTAMEASVIFMALNGYELIYPANDKTGYTELGDIIVRTANGKITIDQLKDWYDLHKQSIP